MVDFSVGDIEGFEPGADAYVYVIELCRVRDDSTWYYTGKSEGGKAGLRQRLNSHANGFNQQRPVFQNGTDILKGSIAGARASYAAEEEYRMVGVDRVEPVYFEYDDLENPLSYDPNEDHWDTIERVHREGVVEEIERRVSYETALRHDTTNVLGGK